MYLDNGIDARLAINDWQLGSDTVGTYLKSTVTPNSDHPSVFIEKSLDNLRLGIQNYTYKEMVTTERMSQLLDPDVKELTKYPLTPQECFEQE